MNTNVLAPYCQENGPGKSKVLIEALETKLVDVLYRPILKTEMDRIRRETEEEGR